MNAKAMFDLTNKVALVTGGSRGLGLYMAHGLVEMGAKVAITARSEHDLAAAQAELEAGGTSATVLAIPHDLSNLGGEGALVDRVVAELGDIDILVNNAAVAIASPAEEHSADNWNRVMDVNINAMFFLTQEVARRCMIPRRQGKILNISSTGGLGGNAIDSPLIISYNASKGAVISLTRALATEWGRHNINVNAIAPGTFPSQMTAATLPEGHRRRVLSKTPLGRLGGEDDIKGVAIFFVSEASRHLTGQLVVLDGGAFTTNYPAVTAPESDQA
jgi:NAD(P)-dependent dehydrogenase (short-subunit alcohol dehydrogenase family)